MSGAPLFIYGPVKIDILLQFIIWGPSQGHNIVPG